MSGKLSSLNRRLAKTERQLIDGAWATELRNCICQKMTLADSDNPEEFEAEMSKTCPAHGYRDLGMIIHVTNVAEPDCAKLNRLLEIYHARCPRKFSISQLRQAGLEV